MKNFNLGVFKVPSVIVYLVIGLVFALGIDKIEFPSQSAILNEIRITVAPQTMNAIGADK